GADAPPRSTRPDGGPFPSPLSVHEAVSAFLDSTLARRQDRGGHLAAHFGGHGGRAPRRELPGRRAAGPYRHRRSIAGRPVLREANGAPGRGAEAYRDRRRARSEVFRD